MNQRLVRLSSTREDFLTAVPPYQETLDKAGYDHKLVWEEPTFAATANASPERDQGG